VIFPKILFYYTIGAHGEDESMIVIDGMSGFNNIGFNGPAGFQGLHLASLHDGNITTALSLLSTNKTGAMVHVRRANDLVGSLGHELDFANILQIADVTNPEQLAHQQHFLNNHGIKPIMRFLHQ